MPIFLLVMPKSEVDIPEKQVIVRDDMNGL